VCNAGRALFDLGSHREALAGYAHAIEFNPIGVLAYVGKGETLYDISEYKQANEAFHTAIRIDTVFMRNRFRNGEVFVTWRNALYKQKRLQDALDYFELAIQLDSMSRTAYDGKIRVLSRIGKHEEAQKAKNRLESILASQQQEFLYKEPFRYER